MKTNKKWYAYDNHGSYYKLEGDVLMFSPMFKSGEMDKENIGEIDWERGVEDGEDRKQMENIVKELQARI